MAERRGKVMIYEFQCDECEVIFEQFCVHYDPTGVYEDVVCPSCGSKKKQKLMSACSYRFSNPVGTDKWNSDSSGHDYRYKYNEPNVRREREVAMKKSHMGSSPYNNIDDISSGKHFGEVK